MSVSKLLKPLIASLVFLPSLSFALQCADSVLVSQASVRLPIPGQNNSAAFMTLSNEGASDCTLISAESQVAKVVELHNHIEDNGIMRMRAVEDIQIPAGATTSLQPGGLHIMLIDLVKPLQKGHSVKLTLKYADGSFNSLFPPIMDIRRKKQKNAHEHHHHHHGDGHDHHQHHH